MLTYQTMSDEYGDQFREAFGVDLKSVLDSSVANGGKEHLKASAAIRKMQALKEGAAKGGPLDTVAATSFITSLIIDRLRKELVEEADRYTAQFGARGAFDQFWVYAEDKRGVQHRLQNYSGFEFVRTTERSRKTPPDGRARGANNTAFKLVCALTPSKDGEVFLVTPIYFKISSAKAKVLSYEWKDWYTTPWTWLLRRGSSVDCEVVFRFDAIWVDDKEGVHTETVCEDSFTVKDYAIDSPCPLPPKVLKHRQRGWFAGIPVSTDRASKRSCGNGTFWLEVVVTERDPSNAVRYLRKGTVYLKEHGADLARTQDLRSGFDY